MNKPCAREERVRVVPVNEMDEWIVCADAARWGGLRDLGARGGWNFAKITRWSGLRDLGARSGYGFAGRYRREGMWGC